MHCRQSHYRHENYGPSGTQKDQHRLLQPLEALRGDKDQVRLLYHEHAGVGSAIRGCHTCTHDYFRGPTQYKLYGSSRTSYSENSYVNDATSTPSSVAVSPDASSIMSSGCNAMSGITDAAAMGSSAGTAADGTVSKSKTELTDSTKIKAKSNNQVTAKDTAGTKMEQ